MRGLYTKASLSLVGLTVSMGLLLFAPPETRQYWQAWVYLAIFTGASLLTTLYLAKNDQEQPGGRSHARPNRRR